ncbi:hypothetical protein GCM10009616_17830 [Microlunatus lacustris]
MPISAAPAKRSETRAAPSSIEYSECTCRWTNESLPLVPVRVLVGVGGAVLVPAVELSGMFSIDLQLAALPACPTSRTGPPRRVRRTTGKGPQ